MALPKWRPSQEPSIQASQRAMPPPNNSPMPDSPRPNACMDMAQLASVTTSIMP